MASIDLPCLATSTPDDWAANTGGKVAAVAADDGATTFIGSASTDQEQFFTVDASGWPGADVINSVRIVGIGRSFAGAGTNVQFKFKIDGTDYVNFDSTATGVSGTFEEMAGDAEALNPDTGLAWTLADLAALVVGAKHLDAVYDIQLTQFVVRVDFDPATLWPQRLRRVARPPMLPPDLYAGHFLRPRIFRYPASVVWTIGSGEFLLNAPVVTFLPSPMQVPFVRIFVQDAAGDYLVP